MDTAHVRAFGGGEATGPSPVDRRKPGTKYTLLVDRRGVPLVFRAIPANRSDHCEILSAVVVFPTVHGRPRWPHAFPARLYADADLDCEATFRLLRWLGIEPHIRRRHAEHDSHLGRVRWVVERTLSWIKGLRRLGVRYDRSQTSINASTALAAAVICLQILATVT